MEIHAGHRDRMKRRFLETGLNGFSDVNALEFLLFYSIARQDTNPLAHELMNRFGSLKGVLEAPVSDLLTVRGIGENSAILLRLISEVSRRYLISKRKIGEQLNTPEDVFGFVMPLFAFAAEERLFMLSLDTNNRVLHCGEISQGDADSVYANPRKIISIAMETKAAKIILAHNHPSGILIPSNEDIRFTEKLCDALLVFHIQLLDHIIVGDGEYVSMRDQGCF